MSAGDVAYIIFNQFFGQSVVPDVIKDLTTKCIEALTESSGKSPQDADFSLPDAVAVIFRVLYHYYIHAGRLSADFNVVAFGSVEFLEAVYEFIGRDTILITNTSESHAKTPGIPVFAIQGESLERDGQLVANAAHKLNEERKRVLLFSVNSVATLLAYVFLIVEGIRRVIAREEAVGFYYVTVGQGDAMLAEAVRLVESLGFSIEALAPEAPAPANSHEIVIRLHSDRSPRPQKSVGELITKVAPSVSVIKQIII